MAFVMAFSYDSRPIQTILNQIRNINKEMVLIFNLIIKGDIYGVRILKINYYIVLLKAILLEM